jgi:hypothetical protein
MNWLIARRREWSRRTKSASKLTICEMTEPTDACARVLIERPGATLLSCQERVCISLLISRPCIFKPIFHRPVVQVGPLPPVISPAVGGSGLECRFVPAEIPVDADKGHPFV